MAVRGSQRIIRGNTAGFVTLITSLKSKGIAAFAAFYFAVACVTVSASELPWFEAKDGKVVVKTRAGSERIFKVPVEVRGVFFDGVQHCVGGNGYISVLQVSDSNPGNPEGGCGSGAEVWLQIMRSNGEMSSRILVSSCLESISLASQNSGLEEQENDFSSIEWNKDGFSVGWFGRKDSYGRSLSSTHYRECGELFCASDVLE
ncbi:hypothetical protein H4C80_04690 [Pseudomonas juntendi]|uniref:Uncharacterized protein n=1 Tax=Pseudomonas juntendi TaxID=2666183 RepID=A0A7W2KDC8_9PSED|nr:hypothetical protein [Pseudomonas juntendi]MBA6096443.1 hypothetical protein [Pseudomonas juntendi]